MHAMYYAPMLRYWQLIRILVRTNHPYLRVGRHIHVRVCVTPCRPIVPVHMARLKMTRFEEKNCTGSFLKFWLKKDQNINKIPPCMVVECVSTIMCTTVITIFLGIYSYFIYVSISIFQPHENKYIIWHHVWLTTINSTTKYTSTNHEYYPCLTCIIYSNYIDKTH
jgi:hypothetical protein